MKRPSLFAALALLFSPVIAAQEPEPAQTPAPVADNIPAAASVGDPARGQQLAYTCQGCHGVTGYRNAYPNYRVPLIGGQSATYLMNALNGYRAGTRSHPTMQAQARSFSDQDIADLTAFLSGVRP